MPSSFPRNRIPGEASSTVDSGPSRRGAPSSSQVPLPSSTVRLVPPSLDDNQQEVANRTLQATGQGCFQLAGSHPPVGSNKMEAGGPDLGRTRFNRARAAARSAARSGGPTSNPTAQSLGRNPEKSLNNTSPHFSSTHCSENIFSLISLSLPSPSDLAVDATISTVALKSSCGLGANFANGAARLLLMNVSR
ncbi:hypothetical protein Droror1_Dr00025640 [Drosera rotundifolia]